MDDIFWLRDNLLAGSAGPNRRLWQVSELVHHGVKRVLSVNDGACIRKEELTGLGIEYACIPLSPHAPPLSGDVEHCVKVLPLALSFAVPSLTSKERTTGATLVHCSSGKDRTGLFFCYYLMQKEHYTCEEAIAEVRRVRPIALSATGWEQHTIDVLNHFTPRERQT